MQKNWRAAILHSFVRKVPTLRKELTRFVPIAKAIAALMHPYAEVILHDTETNTIAAIFNNFSKRAVGESSLLEKEKTEDYPDYFEPYYKINWDGKRLKSTTAVIRDDEGKAVGLICINMDLSRIDEFKQFLDAFTAESLPLAGDLFKDDWREKINAYVIDYAKEKNVKPQDLKMDEKKKIVSSLYKEGAFRAKRAADYVAGVLGISRATVYKHLSKGSD